MYGRPNVLITGATGQIGSAVLRAVMANPELHAIAAARTPDKLAVAGAEAIQLDYDRPDALPQALHGIDRVFLVTGYTIRMLRQSRDFLNAARRAGVQQVVYLGAPGDDDTPVEHWLWHQFVERYVEWCGFNFTHLRPEIFMQNLLGYGDARVVRGGAIRHYVAGTRITWVDGEDIAAVAAASLANPTQHHGKTYRIGTDIKSYGEIAEIMTRVVGKPFSYENRPAEEFLDTVLRAGSDPSYMQSVYESYAALAAGASRSEERLFDTVSTVAGRAPLTMEGFIQKHREAFAY